MTLKVIGPGFGRTGTKTVKLALEHLGFGPCHHMYEVFDDPPQVAHWQDFAAGKPVDFTEVFKGYRSQIDWPGAHVWRELAEAFPDAKVLLTRRPEESWYRSYSRTIGKFMRLYKTLDLPPPYQGHGRYDEDHGRGYHFLWQLERQGHRNRRLPPAYRRGDGSDTVEPTAHFRRRRRMGAAVPLSRRACPEATLPP